MTENVILAIRNDSKVTKINLSNTPISEEVRTINVFVQKATLFLQLLVAFFHSLRLNEHLRELSLANIGMSDFLAFELANSLKENKSLAKLNIESNFVKAETLVKFFEVSRKNKYHLQTLNMAKIVIMYLIRTIGFKSAVTKSQINFQAIKNHPNLREFRACNQHSCFLGHSSEMSIAKLIENNHKLLKLGLYFESIGPWYRINRKLTENQDRVRQIRLIRSSQWLKKSISCIHQHHHSIDTIEEEQQQARRRSEVFVQNGEQ